MLLRRLFLSLAAVVAGGTVMGGEVPPSALRILVEPGERTYLLQEPLTATVTLRNVGSSVVRIPGGMSGMGNDILVIDILSRYGERIGYRRYVEADTMYPPSYKGIEILPGGKHAVWLDLSYQGRGEPVWIVPGDYAISARYSWQNDAAPLITKTTARSEPVAVTVKKPTGREAKAYAMMRAAPDGKRPAAAVAHYRRVMALYPGTRWARWAHLRLAERLAYGLSEQQGGGMVAAVREYRTIVASYPGFPFVDWARYCVATGLESAGRLREAREEQERLLKRAGFPDSLKAMAQAHLRDISRNLSAQERGQTDEPKPVVSGRPEG